jgi:hypothetical protein
MKNLTIYLILSLFLLSSCSDQQKEDVNPDQIECEIGCLFVMENIEATIIYMDCFQKYAIQTQYPDDKSITIYVSQRASMKHLKRKEKRLFLLQNFEKTP